MKFCKKNVGADIVIIVIFLVIFYFIDKNIGQLSEFFQWLLFFPTKAIRELTTAFNLKEDFKIIYTLLTGLPLLVVYWYFLARLINLAYNQLKNYFVSSD